MFTLPLALLGLATPDANAVIYVGNPDLTITVDRSQHDLDSGSVQLDKVRMHACSGTTTDYTVSSTIDPVYGYTLGISGGNYCGVTFFWSSSMLLDGTNNNGAFEFSYSRSTTYVALATPIPPVGLSPITVVYGSPGLGLPELQVAIQ